MQLQNSCIKISVGKYKWNWSKRNEAYQKSGSKMCELHFQRWYELQPEILYPKT